MQHDASEFIQLLLDAIHEGLNTATVLSSLTKEARTDQVGVVQVREGMLVKKHDVQVKAVYLSPFMTTVVGC